jgi:mono/diheme cytochrome c family protein
MRVRIRHITAGFAGALALAAVSTGPAVAQQDDGLPNSPGKDTLIEVCTQCHAIGIVTQVDRAPDEWDELMQRMVGMGAPATPDQQQAILTYLKKNFAKASSPAA